MKSLVFLLFVMGSLWASSIDTRLFEGPEQENYYQEVQKQIETAAKNAQRPKEVLQEEKLYLSRLRSASSQVVQIESSFVKGFEKSKIIGLENYYNVLNAAASLRLTLKSRQEMLEDIQSKLLYLKKLIENIIEEDKPKLLSYQLQYAYYKLQQKNIEAKVNLLIAHEKETIQLLLNNLSLVKCDTAKTIDEKLRAQDTDIEKILQQKIAFQINLEKAQIEESPRIEQIKETIAAINKKHQQALSEKIRLKTKQSICLLKEKKSKEFFRLLDDIKTVIKNISKEDQSLYIEQNTIPRDMAKDVFGAAKIFLVATLHQSMEVLTKLKDSLSSPLFVFNEQPISLFSLFKVIVLITLGFVFGALYKRWIARVSKRWPDMSQMSIRLASNIGYYLIVFVTFIIAIGSVGIDMTSISLIAGALSIGIGFGLQTVVSNLIAGIILMFERTIRIGDTIEISDVLRGRVTDMRIRSTTVKTFDNVDIVVPNSSFIQNNVINWTLDDLSRRLHIPFGVAYGTEAREVIKIILDALEQSELIYIKNDKNKQPEVWMTSMNNSSVDFELLVWVEWDNKFRPNSFKSDFLILIYNTLNKHGIQIPFPQLDLHVKSMPS